MIDWIKKNKSPIYVYGGMILIVILVIIIAVGVQDGAPYNPVAIDLGFAQIAWYSIFILTGLTLAGYLAYLEFKKIGWDPDLLLEALLWGVPVSILGSRLYYVLFDPDYNYETFMDVIDISRGGLSIHGVVITATIFAIVYTKIKKLDFWLVADIVAVGFLIGQIVGRWGNFMNAEAYGPIIESQFILNILPAFIQDQMYIAGAYHHPTFLYEGIWNFIGLVGLLIIRRKRWLKVGDLFAFYLILYGFGRGAIIEPLRLGGHPTDALRMFGLPANVIISLAVFMLGGIAIIVAKRHFLKDQKYYIDTFVDQDIKEVKE